jgi:hypothetical protein
MHASLILIIFVKISVEMKTIKLSEGFSTIVDDEDYVWLSKRSWHAKKNNGNNVYAATSTSVNNIKVCYRMHRLILGVTDRNVLVDHINGDSLDNRRCNLRLCDYSQNTWNRKFSHNSVGVKFDKNRSVWNVQIGIRRNIFDLKGFSNQETAKYVYNKMSLYYRGEFAPLNKIDMSKVIFHEIRTLLTTPKHKIPKNIYYCKSKKKFFIVVRDLNGTAKRVGYFKTHIEAEAKIPDHIDQIKDWAERAKNKGLKEFIEAMRDDPMVFDETQILLSNQR